MSCIQKILEIKGDQEILYVHNELVIEGGGRYKDYDYLITFTKFGTRCGYVALPPNHPGNKFYKKDYNYPPYECHGGITFYDRSSIPEQIFGETVCDDKWIGFDCAHAWDIPDKEAFLKYFTDAGKIMTDHVIEMSHIFECMIEKEKYGIAVRTKEYVEENCKSIIEQLIIEQSEQNMTQVYSENKGTQQL